MVSRRSTARAVRSTRKSTGRTSRQSDTNVNVARSAKTVQKWVQIRKPPAKGVGFEVLTWVPVNKLTAAQHQKLFPLPTEETNAASDEAQGASVPLSGAGDSIALKAPSSPVHSDLILDLKHEATKTDNLADGAVTENSLTNPEVVENYDKPPAKRQKLDADPETVAHEQSATGFSDPSVESSPPSTALTAQPTLITNHNSAENTKMSSDSLSTSPTVALPE
jgi:hypothetical protein